MLDPVKRRATVLRCVHRFRERKRAAKAAAIKAAKAAHRAELAAKREARGLAAAKSAAERAAAYRERLAAERSRVWFAPALGDQEARAYLQEIKPGMASMDKENWLTQTQQDAWILGLNWNRFVLEHGAQAARLRRAIVYQFLDVLYHGDLAHLGEAMERAEHRQDLAFEPEWNEQQCQQHRRTLYAVSQVQLQEGSLCLEQQAVSIRRKVDQCGAVMVDLEGHQFRCEREINHKRKHQQGQKTWTDSTAKLYQHLRELEVQKPQ